MWARLGEVKRRSVCSKIRLAGKFCCRPDAVRAADELLKVHAHVLLALTDFVLLLPATEVCNGFATDCFYNIPPRDRIMVHSSLFGVQRTIVARKEGWIVGKCSKCTHYEYAEMRVDHKSATNGG